MLDFNKFNLFLIRHGQSATNALPDLIGQTGDSPLTDKGKRQAQLLQARFWKTFQSFDHVFSSDYLRAYDTAKIVMGEDHQRIITSPALREYSAGDWTSVSRSKTLTLPVLLKMSTLHNAFLPPNGESMHQVERRASTWLEENVLYNQDIMQQAAQLEGKNLPPLNIAVFSHGMTIKCLLHYVMGFDQSFTYKLTLENTSITKLVFNQEGWRLITINDHAHLL
jgi:broad specificity phosphatase PhoE